MGTTVIGVGIAFVVLLWLSIVLRRRAIRMLLLTSGAETAGRATWDTAGRRRGPRRILVTYVDRDGAVRTLRKSIVSAGDGQLLRKGARVLYHPRRTDRSEYVLVGFGDHPATWFGGTFVRVAHHRFPAAGAGQQPANVPLGTTDI